MNEHYSVLLQESIEALNIQKDGIYVDGTLGYGGHSEAILKKLTTGHLYGFDQDENAITASSQRLAPYEGKFTLIHQNFRYLKEELNQRGVEEVDGLILDLGVSSPMFDQSERGFSYRSEGPLDMRMDQSKSLTAMDIVNGYSESELIHILRDYGEERFAPSIVKQMIAARPIHTTTELVEAIKKGLPSKVKNAKGHPAKKTFQALRIAVNDEMGALEEGLKEAIQLLKKDGRIAIITFQSLEDRMVKKMFQKVSSIDPSYKNLPLKEEEMPKPEFEVLTKHPIVASEEELEANHRSHSAKLRVLLRREKHVSEEE